MNSRIYITFLFLVISMLTKANIKGTIDSLLALIEVSGNDSMISAHYAHISDEYLQINLDSATKYAEFSMNYAEKIDNNYLRGSSYDALAKIAYYKNDLIAAEELFLKAIRFLELENYLEGVSTCYNNLGVILMWQGSYSEAIDYYMKGLDIDDQINDTINMGIKYSNIGDLYNLLEDFEKSRNNYLKALYLMQTVDEKTYIAYIYNNLGTLYINHDKGDSASYYLTKALKQGKIINCDRCMVQSYISLGEIAFQSYEMEKALAYIQEAIKINEPIGDGVSELDAKMRLGAIYARLGQIDKGIEILNETIREYREINDPIGIQHSLLYTYQAYQDNNEYEQALEYYEQYIQIRDSIASEEQKKNIEDLQLKYETEKKDRQLLEQSLTMAKQDQALSRNRWFITTILLVLTGAISIVIFLIIYMRQKKRNYHVNLEKLQKEKEVESLKYLMQGEEQERSRIARELHDGVNGGLAAIKLVAGCELKNQQKENKNLLKISDMLDSMSNEVRDISHNLMPESFIASGLPEAIGNHVDKINKGGSIQLDFQAYGQLDELDMEIKLAVFRIIQELLKNMLKHSKATEGLIQLNKHEKELALVVEDNGVGFDVFEKAKGNDVGIGLKNVFHRVGVLRGTVDIQSDARAGTTISIDIPLN